VAPKFSAGRAPMPLRKKSIPQFPRFPHWLAQPVSRIQRDMSKANVPNPKSPVLKVLKVLSLSRAARGRDAVVRKRQKIEPGTSTLHTEGTATCSCPFVSIRGFPNRNRGGIQNRKSKIGSASPEGQNCAITVPKYFLRCPRGNAQPKPNRFPTGTRGVIQNLKSKIQNSTS
jgi:hypothetical protein